jgi:transcriptional regulator GlxA family with amidase domain
MGQASNTKNQFSSPMKHTNRIVTKDLEIDVPRKSVLFILLEHFSMVSFTGAVDVLVTANLLTRDPVFDVITASHDGAPVKSDLGIDIAVNDRVAAYQNTPIDMIIVCGGLRTSLTSNSAVKSLLKWGVKKQLWMGGLWNGAYFLADLGVFDDKECAVHPDSREILKERFPKVEISKAAYHFDQKVFSAVGPNAAIRVMLDLVEKLFGRDMKRGINGILLADTNRSINSAFANGVTFLPPKLETIIELMESNLEEPLSLSELSTYTLLSRRQVERLFARYLNTSPSKYYLELRLNKGRQLLLRTNYTISEVAMACGFINNTHFSHSFKTHFGASPTSVRLEGKDI